MKRAVSSLVVNSQRPYAARVTSGSHSWAMDEPASLGGSDTGPDPLSSVCGSLASCTVITLRMYAERKKLQVGELRTEVTLGEQGVFERRIQVGGEVDEATRARLLRIANMCPVHKLLSAGATVDTSLV